MELFNVNLYEYSLVFIVGICAGIATIVKEHEIEFNIKKIVKTIYLSIYITSIFYFILSLLNADYYVKVGLSSLVGFLGIDKSIEYLNKILGLKK